MAAARSIVLPDGSDGEAVQWPDLGSNALFVRDFYNDLFSSVLCKARFSKQKAGAIILGMPGIAKSAFGLYVLFRVVREGRTVIYVSRKANRAVFKGGKAYSITGAVENIHELSDANAVYISDSLPPVGSKGAFTLVITSSKKKNWGAFCQSPRVQQLTMPIFDKAEMHALRELAFDGQPMCSAVVMTTRIAKWGCNPRNILTKADDIVWQTNLEQAPSTLRMGALEDALNVTTALQGASSGKLTHRLVNLVPAGRVDPTLETTNPKYFVFHHAELF